MATQDQIQYRTRLEKWQDGIDAADRAWDSYDTHIRSTVEQYNAHLTRSTPAYFPLDWQLVKAMIWTETGARDPGWLSRPMQIGNPGDPGLGVMRRGEEGSNLIVPPALRGSFLSATTNPRSNIEAGVGYLLTRMAQTEIRSVPEPGSSVYDITVKAGDSLSRIAKIEGSTEAMLKQLNPGAHALRPGQVVKCQKATMRRVVTGWRIINTASIAAYNGRGDARYREKLDYALRAMRLQRRAP
jgi:LysM repeat protein